MKKETNEMTVEFTEFMRKQEFIKDYIKFKMTKNKLDIVPNSLDISDMELINLYKLYTENRYDEWLNDAVEKRIKNEKRN